MKLSIRKKLTLMFIITVAVILIIFDLIIYLSFRKSLENNIEQSLINSCKVIVGDIFKQDFEGNLIEKDEEYAEEIKIISEIFPEEIAELIEPAGHCGQLLNVEDINLPEPLARSDYLINISIPYDFDLIQKTIENKTGSDGYFMYTTDSAKIINLYIKDHLGNKFIVQIAEPLENMFKSLKRIETTLLIMSPLFLILLSFVGFGLIKKAFSPIRNIVDDVNNITAKDLSLRIKSVSSKDEIGILISTFNNLISRLENSFAQTKQFSLDVSHELKTPLTVLKGEIEVILRQERDSAEYKNTLESLYEEVEKIQNIINNLLLLSNLESKEHDLKIEQVDLNEILLEVFDNLHSLAKFKNQSIEIKEISSVRINGEKELLIRLFSNILENAIKYTPVNGKIIIEIKKKEKEITVSISDNGIGMKPELQNRIFDRFFRIDESRTSESGGSGLGLAIAKKIAFLHNTTIEVDSSIGEGSTFSVIFPKS